jgi:phosphoglycolate phosphatase
MILILFDIDGTLISTDGAGMRAFRNAVQAVTGIHMESGVIQPDGKTDPLILKEVLEYYKLEDEWLEVHQKEIFKTYLKYLESEMLQSQRSGQNRILPGVKELLETLSRQSDIAIGLATGNLESGARTKLEISGLYRYFQFGGFGSDSEDRTELTRIGIQRGIRKVLPSPVERIFVIGDTPFDILHGHAAGAEVIAVASGRYTINNLRDRNPDLVLRDLTPIGRLLSFFRESGNNRQTQANIR